MPVDLQPTIGLPITMHSGELNLSSKYVTLLRSRIYSLSDMEDYFLNPLSLFPRNIYEQYHVQDSQGSLHNIKVGMTVYKVSSQLIGIEYAKTRSYFLDDYPRVLEVNFGKVIVIIQKTHLQATGKDSDVLICNLSSQDKLVIPPNYGLTVVNNTKRNSVFTVFRNLNEKRVLTMGEKKGGAVYVIYRNKQAEYVKNPYYRNFGSYVNIKQDCTEKLFKISPKTPVLKQFLRKYEKYTWFYNPGSFNWDTLYCP